MHIHECTFFFLQLNYFSRKAYTQYHSLPRTTIIPFVPLRSPHEILSQKVFPQCWRRKVYFSTALKKPAGLLGNLKLVLSLGQSWKGLFLIWCRTGSICLLRSQPWGSSHSSGCFSATAAPEITPNHTINISEWQSREANFKSYSFVQNVSLPLLKTAGFHRKKKLMRKNNSPKLDFC